MKFEKNSGNISGKFVKNNKKIFDKISYKKIAENNF